MGKQMMYEFEKGRGRPPPEDFFVVFAGNLFYRVCPETAAEIVRQVAQRFPPRWIAFVDLDGSRVRMRTRLVGHVSESSALQRQRQREFLRAREREEEAYFRSEEEEQ